MKQRPLVLKVFLPILIILSAGGFWAGKQFIHSRLPGIEGTLTVPHVASETRIIRDRWGVPHIKAGSGDDAYFALGFTAAQDRLFQMELQRRLARGELAEILGPALLDVDKKFRTLMLRHRAEEYLARADRINPDALKFLDAFLNGINFFISRGPLPLEYTLLGTAPRPFTRLDVISMMGYVAYSFADGIKRDALYTILAARLSQADLDRIFPDYTKTNRVTVMQPQGVPPEQASSEPGTRDTTVAVPDDFTGFLASYQALLDKTAALCPPFTGSNSWVLAPERSTNGHALLANDPHIGIANPGVWYEAHVKYPGYENYGYHLPLLPFPMLAHNTTKAWAITMFENDDLDLYAETFHPADPSLVQFKGKWVRINTIEETIRIKGEDDITHIIRVTPHGPVISDFLKGYTGPPVSVSWVYHKLDNPILDVVYDVGRANTMAAFRSAVSRLAAPGLNFSYIDHSGNIGWWAAGRLPIHPAHVSGKMIHDGSSGRDEYIGYLPFDRNPQMENPENGMIITANNLSTMTPIYPIGILTGYFRPDDRAARIYELLAERDKWDMAGLKKIQTDTRLFSGLVMTRAILDT
ncbi:MAG TPA: penicillin acylase, partial [Desulfobacteraceae bacterium]|nr:penicillin acylase [Desulfobacteraceae bacterium]